MRFGVVSFYTNYSDMKKSLNNLGLAHQTVGLILYFKCLFLEKWAVGATWGQISKYGLNVQISRSH